MTLAELLGELTESIGSRREATVILEEAAGEGSAALYAHLETEVPDTVCRVARALGRRRQSGEPLQHVLGHWSFRGLELVQDRRGLIVRPETELVAELALAELARQRHGPGLRALDLGTGSGAIALSLAAECAGLTVCATDRSLDTLALAAENRERTRTARGSRVALLGADWFAPLARRRSFHLVVANPPYLSEQEWRASDPVVRDFDPHGALVAGPGGLEALGAILRSAPEHCAPGGAVVLEIGASQGEAARALALGAGMTAVEVRPDLAGRDRVLVARC